MANASKLPIEVTAFGFCGIHNQFQAEALQMVGHHRRSHHQPTSFHQRHRLKSALYQFRLHYYQNPKSNHQLLQENLVRLTALESETCNQFEYLGAY